MDRDVFAEQDTGSHQALFDSLVLSRVVRQLVQGVFFPHDFQHLVCACQNPDRAALAFTNLLKRAEFSIVIISRNV